MTRISTRPIATLPAEGTAARPAATPSGAPFRALLRAAGGSERASDVAVDTATTGGGTRTPGKAAPPARKTAAVDDGDLVQATAIAQAIAVAANGTTAAAGPSASSVPRAMVDDDAPTAPISRASGARLAGSAAPPAAPAATLAASPTAIGDAASTSANPSQPSITAAAAVTATRSPRPSAADPAIAATRLPHPSAGTLSPRASAADPATAATPSPQAIAADPATAATPSPRAIAAAAATTARPSQPAIAAPAEVATRRAAPAASGKPAAAQAKAATPELPAVTGATAPSAQTASPAPPGSIAEAVASLTGEARPATQPTSPLGAWLPASRAIAAASSADATTGSEAAAVAGTAPASAPSGFDLSTTALTPLEQAVHDLIGTFSARPRAPIHADDRDPADAAPAQGLDSLNALGAFAPVPRPAVAFGAPAIAASPTHATTLAQPPEPAANPSHVHLVLDDGPERVVVTVAMRGTDVHVTMRGSDDATTAALARNAASLDHAMRARGLARGEFTAERELPQDRPRHHRPDAAPPKRGTPDTEPFTLEETP